MEYPQMLLKGSFKKIMGRDAEKKKEVVGFRKVSERGWTSVEWTPLNVRANLVVKVRTGSNLPVFRELDRQIANEAASATIPALVQAKPAYEAAGLNFDAILKDITEKNNLPSTMRKGHEDPAVEAEEILANIPQPPLAQTPTFRKSNQQNAQIPATSLPGLSEDQLR